MYAEETEEPAPVPVGLARHQTKWPCDHIGPPGPPPAGLSPPLDPGGSQWPKYPPSGRPDLLAALGPEGRCQAVGNQAGHPFCVLLLLSSLLLLQVLRTTLLPFAVICRGPDGSN